VTGCFEGGVYVLDGVKGGGYAKPVALKDKAGGVLRLGQYWDDAGNRWTGAGDHPSELGISAFPFDWDGDGDLDLLLGSNSGALFVRRNEGTAQKAAFATESVAMDVKVSTEAMPFLADWDGDGLVDLLCGTGVGGVVWFRNVGRQGAPSFGPEQTLVATNGPAGRPWPSQRTQVSVSDHDGDGDLDLLIGDAQQGGEGEKVSFHGHVWWVERKGTVAAK
jgi:hypothetical protein